MEYPYLQVDQAFDMRAEAKLAVEACQDALLAGSHFDMMMAEALFKHVIDAGTLPMFTASWDKRMNCSGPPEDFGLIYAVDMAFYTASPEWFERIVAPMGRSCFLRLSVDTEQQDGRDAYRKALAAAERSWQPTKIVHRSRDMHAKFVTVGLMGYGVEKEYEGPGEWSTNIWTSEIQPLWLLVGSQNPSRRSLSGMQLESFFPVWCGPGPRGEQPELQAMRMSQYLGKLSDRIFE